MFWVEEYGLAAQLFLMVEGYSSNLRMAAIFEALCYKPEGSGFDSR
jgi:hypothetical protein